MKLPETFINSLHRLFDRATADTVIAAIEAQNPPVSLRINPAKFNRPLILESIPWARNGYYLPQRPVFTKDPLFHAGAYYVQEASSMILEKVLEQVRPDMPMRVLDLCAAPGGKSTHLLSHLEPGDLLVSNEVIRSRANVLIENITKWGSRQSVITSDDPREFGTLRGFFDVLVVDAPCSGEGMFRKDEEAVQEWSPEHVQLCQDRQERILSDSWDCLAEGGVLIYSTCTFNDLENEKVLEWLIREFHVEPVDLAIPPNCGIIDYEVGALRGYKMLPGVVKGEGFCFFAVRKNGGFPRWEAELFKKKHKKNKSAGTRQERWDVPGLSDKESVQLAEQDQKLLAVVFPDEVEELKQHVRVIRSGILLGEIKKKLIPSQEWALSDLLDDRYWPTIALNYEQALSYLMKEVFNPEASERGFALVTYDGLPLGWINHLGNRFNNLYPSSWRIQRDFRNEDPFSISRLT